MASRVSQKPVFKHIPNKSLFVSEPNPSWFGNQANEPKLSNWTNNNWLKSRFHFAFAEYRNLQNSSFGCLRVMNDDLVQPERGFGTHSHADAEIMTYVVEGSLEHEDSMGNKGSVTRGGIQYMSAGAGVQHSEFNHGKTPLRFIQCWVTPSERGVAPNYGQFDAVAGDRLDKLLHLVSSINDTDTNTDTPIKVHQDVNLYASELSIIGNSVTFLLKSNRMLYLTCMEGSIDLKVTSAAASATSAASSDDSGDDDSSSGCEVCRHDAVEVQGLDSDEVVITITAKTEGAHFMFFEMKQDSRAGRTDIV